MKAIASITTLLALIVAAVPAHAQRRRATAAPPESLSIELLDGGSGEAAMTAAGCDAWIDLNVVSGTGGHERVTRIRRRFGIRVARSGAIATGTAVITARIEAMDGRALLRLDGRPLTAVPFVVDAHAAIGRVTWHTLEIEIAADAAEGPLATSIAWEVTTE